MKSERMTENWVKEMISHLDLESSEAWSAEDFNAAWVEITFSLESTPEWEERYLEAMEESYVSAFEKVTFTADIYNAELRRVFQMQEAVVEMPAQNQLHLSMVS